MEALSRLFSRLDRDIFGHLLNYFHGGDLVFSVGYDMVACICIAKYPAQ